MTLKEELYQLFDAGKTPPEIINLGYKRATSYRLFKEWLLDKEREKMRLLIDESESAKKVFQCIENGMTPTKIVLDVGLPPKKVMEYYEDYVKLGEISQEYVEKVKGLAEKELRFKETSMRIDENEVRLNETEGEIERLNAMREECLRRLEIFHNSSGKVLSAVLKDRISGLEYEIECLNVEKMMFETYDAKKKGIFDSGYSKETKKRLAKFDSDIVLKREQIQKIRKIISELE